LNRIRITCGKRVALVSSENWLRPFPDHVPAIEAATRVGRGHSVSGGCGRIRTNCNAAVEGRFRMLGIRPALTEA
jgi:hypothetical protein